MDDGGALRLEPERDAGAGEARAVVGDERDVRDAAYAHEPWRRTAFSNAFQDRREDVLVREVVDRAPDRVGERRPDADDDLHPVAAA